MATISWIADVIVTIGIIQIPQLMKLKQICLSFGNPSRAVLVKNEDQIKDIIKDIDFAANCI